MVDWQKLNRICYFPASQVYQKKILQSICYKFCWRKDYVWYPYNIFCNCRYWQQIMFAKRINTNGKLHTLLLLIFVSIFPVNMQRQISNSFAIAKVSEFVTQECNSIWWSKYTTDW